MNFFFKNGGGVNLYFVREKFDLTRTGSETHEIEFIDLISTVPPRLANGLIIIQIHRINSTSIQGRLENQFNAQSDFKAGWKINLRSMHSLYFLDDVTLLIRRDTLSIGYYRSCLNSSQDYLSRRHNFLRGVKQGAINILMADISGGSLGANSFIFMKFLAKVLRNNRLVHPTPLEELIRFPSGKILNLPLDLKSSNRVLYT